jgi:hypothetical protein
VLCRGSQRTFNWAISLSLAAKGSTSAFLSASFPLAASSPLDSSGVSDFDLSAASAEYALRECRSPKRVEAEVNEGRKTEEAGEVKDVLTTARGVRESDWPARRRRVAALTEAMAVEKDEVKY